MEAAKTRTRSGQAAGQGAVVSHVGVIDTLWRYPVKSMLGERRPEVELTVAGVVGDRAWALRETSTGRIASAKRFPRLLEFQGSYETEPTRRVQGRVRIDLPSGRVIHADDANASDEISAALGVPVRLESRPRSYERTGIDRETVFGGVPVGIMKPDWTPATMPDFFELKTGTFMEIGAVFLLASGSVELLRALQGGTATIDQRRFRPNIYVDSGPSDGVFVEDDWVGRDVKLGADVTCSELAPTLWCVTSTLAVGELPRDPSILRTIAHEHRGCLGVYASVASPGSLRVGDPVSITH
jgi:uncharacterized protein YcbX